MTSFSKYVKAGSLLEVVEPLAGPESIWVSGGVVSGGVVPQSASLSQSAQVLRFTGSPVPLAFIV